MADDISGIRKPADDSSPPPDGNYREPFDGFTGASGPAPAYAPPNNGRSLELAQARREFTEIMGDEHPA